MEVPINTFWPPTMESPEPTVNEPKVVVPMPPLATGKTPVTLEVKLIKLAVICCPERDK